METKEMETEEMETEKETEEMETEEKETEETEEMEQTVYILETKDGDNHAFVDKNLFFREWAYYLSKHLEPLAYIIDYSKLESCNYQKYQAERESLIEKNVDIEHYWHDFT